MLYKGKHLSELLNYLHEKAGLSLIPSIPSIPKPATNYLVPQLLILLILPRTKRRK